MGTIKTAVFPVAGLGTRFLPATKAMPKEMLTVVDRPIIQYVVDEAREAGIENFIFVTGRNKSVIADHFDVQFELEHTLEVRGKTEALAELRRELAKPGQYSFTRQQEPLGLGHAVWCARHLINHEPFALLLPDMLMPWEPGCLASMVTMYEKYRGNIISVEEVDPSETYKYGIVSTGAEVEGGYEITGMVEKPKVEEAPSNLMISGRYILQPEIMNLLAAQERGTGNEIQLTDSLLKLAKTSPFFAYNFPGKTYDCGSKTGFLAANVRYALSRDDIAPDFKPILDEILRNS